MKHTQKEHTSSLLFEQQRTLIEELAQKHGILKRRRQIRSIGELLFMLQLVALADTCLRTAAELFSGLFRPIRDSSLYERLCSLQPLLRELLLTLSENSLKLARIQSFCSTARSSIALARRVQHGECTCFFTSTRCVFVLPT